MKMKMILIAIWVFILSSFVYSVETAPKSRWAKFGEYQVHYYDVGKTKSKQALVLVHGWTCNADFWKDTYSAFPEYRVIAVDLPGHGQSDKPKTDYSMEYFARSIDAVMKNAKVQKAVLVGHSMGTPVIRQFYRIFPDETLGLVIVDGALRPFAPKADLDKFFAPLRTNYKENGARFIDGLLGPVKDENLKAVIRTAMLATPDYVAVNAMDGMLDEKIWASDRINVPVLAIMAESPHWPPDTKAFYAEIAPNLDFQSWQGVSHFLMMEKPAEFNLQLSHFIAKNNLFGKIKKIEIINEQKRTKDRQS